MNVFLGCGPASFVLEDHDVTTSVFDNGRVDNAEALIVEQPRWSECMKVFRRGDVDAMIAFIVATLIRCGKSSGDGRGPEQEVLPLLGVIEEFRRPNV